MEISLKRSLEIAAQKVTFPVARGGYQTPGRNVEITSRLDFSRKIHDKRVVFVICEVCGLGFVRIGIVGSTDCSVTARILDLSWIYAVNKSGRIKLVYFVLSWMYMI